jgi:soluble lytic murein transglycosylase-like protein
MAVASVGIVNNVKATAELRQTEEEKIVEVKPTEPEVVIVEPKQVYYDVPLSETVQDTIFDECEKYGISPTIVIAQIEKESQYDTYAIGDDGRSAGLMQIQAKWHLQRMVDLNCTDLFNPSQNVTVGIDYLAYQLNRYGDMAKALTAYNRGNYNGTITEYAKTILANAEKVGERK